MLKKRLKNPKTLQNQLIFFWRSQKYLRKSNENSSTHIPTQKHWKLPNIFLTSTTLLTADLAKFLTFRTTYKTRWIFFGVIKRIQTLVFTLYTFFVICTVSNTAFILCKLFTFIFRIMYFFEQDFYVVRKIPTSFFRLTTKLKTLK